MQKYAILFTLLFIAQSLRLKAPIIKELVHVGVFRFSHRFLPSWWDKFTSESWIAFFFFFYQDYPTMQLDFTELHSDIQSCYPVVIYNVWSGSVLIKLNFFHIFVEVFTKSPEITWPIEQVHWCYFRRSEGVETQKHEQHCDVKLGGFEWLFMNYFILQSIGIFKPILPLKVNRKNKLLIKGCDKLGD